MQPIPTNAREAPASTLIPIQRIGNAITPRNWLVNWKRGERHCLRLRGTTVRTVCFNSAQQNACQIAQSGTCHVKNVWDTGDGTIQIWHNGAAMIVERAGNARRYRCNDGNPNADFDDLIFRVVLTG